MSDDQTTEKRPRPWGSSSSRVNHSSDISGVQQSSLVARLECKRQEISGQKLEIQNLCRDRENLAATVAKINSTWTKILADLDSVLPTTTFGKDVAISLPLHRNPGQDDHQLLSVLETQRRLLGEKITTIASILRGQQPVPPPDTRKLSDKVKEVRSIQLYSVVCDFATQAKGLEAKCYTAQKEKEELERLCESLRSEVDNTTQRLQLNAISSTCKCVCKCGARNVQGPDLTDEKLRKYQDDLLRVKSDLEAAAKYRQTLEEQNVKLTAELRVSEERFLSTRTFKRIMRQAQALMDHVSRLKAENEDLKKEREDAHDLLKVEVDRARRAEEARREDLERRFHELTSRFEREVLSRQAAQAELEGIRKEHTGVIRLKEIEDQLSIREMEIDSLRRRYKEQRTTREELELKSDQDFQKIMNLQDEIAQKDDQLATLQAKLSQDRPRDDEPMAESDLQARVAHYKEELAKSRDLIRKLESRAAHTQSKLITEKAGNKRLIEEVDCTGKAYDEAMKQVKFLQQQTKDHDQVIAKIMSERISEDRSKHLLEAESKKCRERVEAQNEVVEAQKKFISQVELSKSDLEQALKQLQLKLKETENKLKDLESRCSNDLRSHEVIEAVQRQAQEQCREYEKHLIQTASEAAQTKFQCTQMAEELARVKSELQQHKILERHKSSDIVLTEELMKMRGMTRCAACAVRLKEVLISKCFHAFCRQCIDAKLMKDRDCPICRHQFTEAEIKEIWW